MKDSTDSLIGLLTFYEKANFALRLALLIAVLWPFSVIGTAMALDPSTAQTVVPLVDLVPLAAVFFLVIGAPFGLLVLLRDPTARKGLSWVSALIGVELAIGVYFSTVPVSKDIGLIPLLVLSAFAILFLRIGGIAGFLTKSLVVVIVVITFIFVFGGRRRFENDMEHAFDRPSQPAAAERPSHVAARERIPGRLKSRSDARTSEPVKPGPIDSGPVAAIHDADIYQFGFWPCRRVAAAVFCEGYIRNEYTHMAYQPLSLSNIKDNLGNEYTPQEFSDNGYDCMRGCSPQLDPQGSHKFRLKVDGVISNATSLTLFFHLERSQLSEGYAASTAMDFSMSVPIGTAR